MNNNQRCAPVGFPSRASTRIDLLTDWLFETSQKIGCHILAGGARNPALYSVDELPLSRISCLTCTDEAESSSDARLSRKGTQQARLSRARDSPLSPELSRPHLSAPAESKGTCSLRRPLHTPCQFEDPEEAEGPKSRDGPAPVIPRGPGQDRGWRNYQLEQPARDYKTVEKVEVVSGVLSWAVGSELHKNSEFRRRVRMDYCDFKLSTPVLRDSRRVSP